MSVNSALTLVKVTLDFDRAIKKLEVDWKSVKVAYGNLAHKQLIFAQRLKDLWIEAKRIDKQNHRSTHQNIVRVRLCEIIQSDDRSILSRWVTIGSNATALLPYASSLPSTRDALYATAQAAESNKPFVKWIESNQLGPNTSIRDVNALVRGPINKKPNRNKRREQELISVKLTFSGSYAEVAEQLVNILSLETLKDISSHQALQECFKSLIGKDRYQALSVKFL